jgi:hypothetical protein
MSKFQQCLSAATLSLASIASFAQAAPTPVTPRVDQRDAHQDARIRNGVASGDLTARETYRLEKEQAAVHRAEANAKADGKVTARERARLHRLQNRASKDIHAQRHDAQTATP